MRVTVITLGVRDLASARAFYVDGMGLAASASSNEHISFLHGGVVLALFGRDALAKDACLEPTESTGFSGVTLAWNVGSRAEVDQGLARAAAAGAKIQKPAAEAFWGGYSGYFADPDGHVWEIAHNPFWELDADGAVLLPP